MGRFGNIDLMQLVLVAILLLCKLIGFLRGRNTGAKTPAKALETKGE